MENETLLLIAAVVVVVLGLLVLAWSRRQEADRERRREEAAEHRRLAAVTGLEAEKRAAAAEERAARATREQLEAEEERIEAMRASEEASELHRKADELDPDVDLDARRRRRGRPRRHPRGPARGRSPHRLNTPRCSTGAVRLLLTLHDAGGTVPPVLALAEAAVARGHEVTVLAQPSVQRRAEAAGADVVHFSALPDYDHRRSFDDQLHLVGAAMVGREVGDDLLAVAADVAADAVVVDANLAGALAAAETMAVPTVVLLHSMYATYTDVWFAELWPLLAGAVNATRAGYGLGAVDGWPGVFAGHDRRLAVVPSSFEAPTAAMPDDVLHAGFLVPRTAPDDGPSVSFPDGDGPTVLVGLGTTSQGQAPMLQAIVDGLAALPVRAVVTTAGQGEVAGTGNVTVVDRVPHGRLLPATDVFVHHGGLGSCAAGLAAGVPLVCTPIDRDQPLNAERVVALGAGITTTPDGVGDAVLAVLGDPSHRAAAQAVAEQSRAEGGPEAAIADLEALLS